MPTDPVHDWLRHPPTEPWYLPWPEWVSLELTSRCQLRCRHCYNRSSPEATQELPFDTIRSILGELSWNGAISIRLTGGEPTLHPHFADILQTCAESGIVVEVNSHGVFSDTLLERMATAPVARFLISDQCRRDAGGPRCNSRGRDLSACAGHL
jgi:MoaA/NifB/PqqE/SkfB family radical SAM enzyme